MKDTKEKVSKLSAEDEDQVSGGYLEQEKVYCDVCHRAQKWKVHTEQSELVYKERLIIPFQGGHICVDCLKKIEEELGRKIL